MKPVLCEKKTYTVAEITKILGISKTAAYALIKENKFKCLKIGKSIRINKESFDKWFYSEEQGVISNDCNYYEKTKSLQRSLYSPK